LVLPKPAQYSIIISGMTSYQWGAMAIKRVAVQSTAEQIEKNLITAILDGELPPGSTLPSERDLAEQMGVTRPTLRETLKQLAKEGWVKIQHGRPTRVADYWHEGGLGVLKTLAKHGDMLSPELVGHLLEFRASLQPVIAKVAAQRNPQGLLEHLQKASSLPDQGPDYVEFDWQLQVLTAELTGNPIFRLIINDFARAFSILAGFYFKEAEQRRRSQAYYKAMADALQNGGSVELVVRQAMEESATVWARLTKALEGESSA
jgi:GntR family negative regulator for fad regulon and positive regulator of fabA